MLTPDLNPQGRMNAPQENSSMSPEEYQNADAQLSRNMGLAQAYSKSSTRPIDSVLTPGALAESTMTARSARALRGPDQSAIMPSTSSTIQSSLGGTDTSLKPTSPAAGMA